MSGEGRGGGNLVTIEEGRQHGRHSDSITAKNQPFYDARNREETVELTQIKEAIAERAKIMSKPVKVPEKEPIVITIGDSFDNSELLKEYAAFTKEHEQHVLRFIRDVTGGTDDKREFEESCKKLVSCVMYFPEEFLKNKEQMAEYLEKTNGAVPSDKRNELLKKTNGAVPSHKRNELLIFSQRKYRKFATPLKIHVQDPKPIDGDGVVEPKSDHPHLKAFNDYKMKLTFYDLQKLAKEVIAAS